jgi:hypothetical protein
MAAREGPLLEEDAECGPDRPDQQGAEGQDDGDEEGHERAQKGESRSGADVGFRGGRRRQHQPENQEQKDQRFRIFFAHQSTPLRVDQKVRLRKIPHDKVDTSSLRVTLSFSIIKVLAGRPGFLINPYFGRICINELGLHPTGPIETSHSIPWARSINPFDHLIDEILSDKSMNRFTVWIDFLYFQR